MARKRSKRLLADETQDVDPLLGSKIRKTAGESPGEGKKMGSETGKADGVRKGDCADGVAHSHPLLMIKNP